MASSIITKHFTLQILVCLFVILVVKMVTSVQHEKCFPQIDRVKYWAEVGSQFEVNCTLINCNNHFETPVWERNGKRLRNYRINQAFFFESKRQKLLIDPVEEGDKGEYTCRTQIYNHSQNLELIIGVEPTTPTTTTTTTPSPTTTTMTTASTSTSTTAKATNFVSTATATFKVTNTPIKIIKTTKMLITFTNKPTTTPETNHSSRLLNNMSMMTFLLLILVQIFMR